MRTFGYGVGRLREVKGAPRSWALVAIAVTALGLGAACDKRDEAKAEPEAAGEAPGAAAPEAVPPSPEPEAAEGQQAEEAKERAGSGEPAATPARESLALLAERGSASVSSIRQERKAIYRLFGTVSADAQRDISAAVALAQKARWDERPERLSEIPGQLHEAVTALLPLSAKYIDAATEKLQQYAELQKEAEGGKKVNEKKMDALQEQGSGEMKVGRNLSLLVRSLLDEARVFAELGSLAMRAELRDRFGPLRGRPMPTEHAELGLQKLLFELSVPGVERPRLD